MCEVWQDIGRKQREKIKNLMNQYKIILNYLRQQGGWIKEGLIRGMNTEWGFIGFRGDRNVRDLIKWGVVDVDTDGRFRIVKYNEKKTRKFLDKKRRAKELTEEEILRIAVQ